LTETDAEWLLGGPLARESRAAELLRRPEVTYEKLMRLPGIGPGESDSQVAEQVEIQAKYAGYIERQREEIERQRRQEHLSLPPTLDYAEVRGLSREVREKLERHRPQTLGQAGRIPGMTPAAISLLLVHLKRGRPAKTALGDG
jgi:tRNA uridine 5-carboxymethylaminomethyl modification enzyme